ESYERIHRSNLVGMGVLPLQFKEGESAAALGLTGQEVFDVTGLSDHIKPRQEVSVSAVRPDGTQVNFTAVSRLDSAIEVDYYKNGGILQTVLRGFLQK
ncbi:MAG: aconitate hydratase, partial [candidate division NC10 bacterium]|nr:aconitate hydratase [candidate division NC10 bacterium]